MKLSIVIPAYNEEKYIGICLDSIFENLNKKNHDVEVIVVDNACTDRTAKIAQSYPSVKLVHEPKKGLVRARQAGFLVSTGDLIANMDADTKITENWLDTIFLEFSSNPDLAALTGPCKFFDLTASKKILVKFFYFLVYLNYLFQKIILRKAGFLQGANNIVRRDALLKAGGYNRDIDFYGEDTDLAKRIQKEGKIKFLFHFYNYTSARRLNSEGIIKMGLKYIVNYLWISFFKKPFSKKVIDVR